MLIKHYTETVLSKTVHLSLFNSCRIYDIAKAKISTQTNHHFGLVGSAQCTTNVLLDAFGCFKRMRHEEHHLLSATLHTHTDKGIKVLMFSNLLRL